MTSQHIQKTLREEWWKNAMQKNGNNYDPAIAEIADWWLDKLSQTLTEQHEEDVVIQNELYQALKMMYEQYCPGEYGHNFMTAGENAEVVLQKYDDLLASLDEEKK